SPILYSEGSNLTPAHHYPDFRFKTYAPLAFRYFRELFGIKPDDYLYSICNEPLIELSNPGASSSLFYLTSDDEFIIKTVQHKEAEFLQKLLPGYYMNLNQNPRTLLPKFYGLYCVQSGGINIRIVVMNNVLPRSVKMHYKMGGIPAKTHKDEKLLIFLGIIDILQSYRLIKKLEHSWKALVYDGDSVSVHRPSFYADRFLKFMNTRVFKKIHTFRCSPSKRARNSIPALKSSSHEIISPQNEEQTDERKERLSGAKSLANLDGQGIASHTVQMHSAAPTTRGYLLNHSPFSATKQRLQPRDIQVLLAEASN
ncbi:UNVERIFIED_CONTAM: hypothetical protein FKN15_017658, partial [Acipenser sinensis]